MDACSEDPEVALATINLNADVIRNGPIDGFTPPDLLEAARFLGDNRTDPVANYFRRVGIDELKTLRRHVREPVAHSLVAKALELLVWEDPGFSTCDWESTEDPTDTEDTKFAGARLVRFAFRVQRPLDQTLRAILDPQSWDDNSVFMKKAYVVDPPDIQATPVDQDVPEKTNPPQKGSDWNPKPLPPLFERFEVPATLGGFVFKQIFTVTPQVSQSSYSFDYALQDCRWSVILWIPNTGGIVRNQGTLTAQEQTVGGQTWTYISVTKSFKVARNDFTAQQQDDMTRVTAQNLKAGWREQLVGAVTNCV